MFNNNNLNLYIGIILLILAKLNYICLIEHLRSYLYVYIGKLANVNIFIYICKV